MRRQLVAGSLVAALWAAGCGSSSGSGELVGDGAGSAGGNTGTGAMGSGGEPAAGSPGAGGAGAGGGVAGGAAGGSGAAGGVSQGGNPRGGVPPVDGGAPVVPADLEHTFPLIDVGPGQEITGLCQSWTVDNPGNVFVNRIESHNDGSMHHSNWIWVPDTLYPGPDGTWNCADRGFDQIIAGAQGGVFFAQSTQSLSDTQQFPQGVAFEMPPRVRIIGDLHLLNTSAEPIQTQLHFDVFSIPSEEVTVPLQPMAFTNLALDIAPQMQTEAHMQCAAPQPDFDVYYVLPHYHSLGTAMRIDVAGGPMDGTALFDSEPTFGEPWGQTFDPPFAVRGATGLGVTCYYENPRTVPVGYGTGDQEMCVTLIYSSGRKAGGMANLNLTAGDVGGVHQTDGLCLSVGQ